MVRFSTVNLKYRVVTVDCTQLSRPLQTREPSETTEKVPTLNKQQIF